ncbi:MAG: ABC transporter ATP-binding protein [Burkholderiales bacterium]|nr:ABC transporter ATP-binding protein [Burkholderiales bacterium]
MTEPGLHVRLRQQGPIPLDAALECAPGEVLALVGPSGSGKTTILRAIAGLLQVGEGSIRINGDTWFDANQTINLPARGRRVGYVFQSYALFPHLSALHNVMEALLEYPPAERERRAREALSRVRLAGLEERLPRNLSGGQQQRVAVARALAREPKVLLLDEPFSAVDRATRQRLYRELAELRRELAMPVILVTHDLDEALMLADRLCVLHQGRTLQSGEPCAVMTRPESVEVAQLVGLRNVFRAGVLGHDESRGMTTIEWRGHRLEARLQPAFAPGMQVTWAIPQGHIVLHRRDRPSRGERENPVSGPVIECIALGENVALTVAVNGPDRPPLFLNIPAHVARRNDIAAGVEIGLSLLADGIHLMPADDSRTPAKPR